MDMDVMVQSYFFIGSEIYLPKVHFSLPLYKLFYLLVVIK